MPARQARLDDPKYPIYDLKVISAECLRILREMPRV